MARYIYQRTGGPLVQWNSNLGRPPYQTRAADAKSLGSLGGAVFDTEFDGRPLPRPGAPEFLGAIGKGSCCDDCSCAGCPDCAAGRGRIAHGGARAAGRVGTGVGTRGALGCGGGETVVIDFTIPIAVGVGYLLGKWLGKGG